MLVFAAELVLQTTSSSLLAFVACNLIIFVIFVGSRFGGSRDATTMEMEAMPVFGIHRNVKWVEIPSVEPLPSGQIVCSSCHEKQREEKLELEEVEEVCEDEINREGENEDNSGWECTHEDEKREDNGEEDCNDFNGDGADELKRRIDDFIAKVNKTWAKENSMEEQDEPLALITTSACAVL